MNIYYRYLEGCRNFNELNDLPEEGWEWHHTLPRCIFGDQPIGLWLTKEQHALATLLQSLIFNRCCLFGDQLKLLLVAWKSLGEKVYKEGAASRGRLGGISTRDKKVGLFAMNYDDRLDIASMVGHNNVKLGRGIWNPVYGDQKSEWVRKGGQKQGAINQIKLGKKVVAVVNSQVTIFASVNEASRQTGISTSNICKVCKGKRKTAGGISFAYLD